MPIVIVQKAGTLADLASTLLRPRTGRAARGRVLEAIAAANPGLDVDALVPGQVLLVPDAPELRPRAPQEAPGTADVADPVADGVERLREAVEQDARRAEAERAELEKVADSREVRALLARQPDRVQLLEEAVKATLDEAAAQEHDRGALQEASRGWLADLKGLHARP